MDVSEWKKFQSNILENDIKRFPAFKHGKGFFSWLKSEYVVMGEVNFVFLVKKWLLIAF